MTTGWLWLRLAMKVTRSLRFRLVALCMIGDLGVIADGG